MLKTKQSPVGFTLIELLVVIGIIGILTALVLIALGISRQKAQDVRVQSNIKQMRNLAELYYDSNGASYDNLYQCVTTSNSTNNSYCAKAGIGASVQALKSDTASVNGGWPSGRGIYVVSQISTHADTTWNSIPSDRFCATALLREDTSAGYVCTNNTGELTFTSNNRCTHGRLSAEPRTDCK